MPTATTPVNTALGPVRVQFPNLISKPPLPKQALKATAAGTADTNGWDTVFAIPVQYVNQAIAASRASPTSFAHSDSTIPASITGTFGVWQIALGGSGELLAMTIPITSATLTYNGVNTPLTDLTATVLVNLTYAQQSNQPASGQTYNLVINPAPVGTPAVTVEMLAPANPNTMIQLVTQALLDQWLNANIASFVYVFNTVNLNMQADNGQWQWLMPTAVAYAYADDPAGSLNNSTFAVLCMTQNHPAPTPQVSPYAIPEGAQAGFCISATQYLGNLILPMMPQVFANASQSDFSFDPSTGILSNLNDVEMDPVNINNSDRTTTVPAGGLSVEVSGSELVVTVTNAHLTYSPGIDIYVSYTQWYQIALQEQSGGTQTIVFNQSTVPGHTEASFTHTVEVATWVQVTEAIMSIIAAAIGAACGFGGPFESLVVKIVVAIIIAIVLAVIANIAQYIAIAAEKDWDKLPSIDMMVTNATSPITWPGGTSFTPTSAQLNGCLQLGGSMSFA